MKKINSCVSFFRRQLKIKGQSEHTGRGAYEMDFDCTVADLALRIQIMIDRTPEMFIIGEYCGYKTVTVKSEYTTELDYRKLCFNGTMLFIIMA